MCNPSFAGLVKVCNAIISVMQQFLKYAYPQLTCKQLHFTRHQLACNCLPP